MPENIVLAMSIAMKRNEKIESVLSELPNYVITDSIAGDNKIGNDVLDNLEVIIKAIQNQKQVAFYYQNIEPIYLVDPYKVVLTNHTYYLYARHDDITKKFDVSGIHDLKQSGSFKPSEKVYNEINEKLHRYGIKNGNETTLRVKCVDLETLLTFDKYFEGKGTKDLEELTYTVVGNSENELYYPLFRISTKCYKFLDEDFKNKYLMYLRAQIKSIEKENFYD
jgi:predicted DNA-binding transcriptional regulator YafY